MTSAGDAVDWTQNLILGQQAGHKKSCLPNLASSNGRLSFIIFVKTWKQKPKYC